MWLTYIKQYTQFPSDVRSVLAQKELRSVETSWTPGPLHGVTMVPSGPLGQSPKNVYRNCPEDPEFPRIQDQALYVSLFLVSLLTNVTKAYICSSWTYLRKHTTNLCFFKYLVLHTAWTQIGSKEMPLPIVM